MNTPNDGGPAFPVPDSHHANGQIQYGSNGMTLRQYIATAALQGILANGGHKRYVPSRLASHAVTAADALIAELGKEAR